MDAAYLSAFAALAGSAIGGLTSLAASWLTQRVQVNAQQLAHDIGRREELYKEFIEEASKTYADAVEHSETNAGQLVCLYALVSRMRVLSSQLVVEHADMVMRHILDTYRSPNRKIPDVAESLLTDTLRGGALDPLRDFSEACRQEFRTQFGPPSAAPDATARRLAWRLTPSSGGHRAPESRR